MKNIKYYLPLIIFIAIALFFWKGLAHDPHEIPSALIDKPVPEFSYLDLLEDKILTQDIFKNKISILNVWATWCPTCYADHAMMMNIAHTYDVAIFGLDYKDDKRDAINFLDQNGNPYEAVIYDPNGKLAMELGVYGTPETFVIDKKGMIRYKHIGAVSPNVWNDKLKPLLDKLKQE